LIPEEVNGRGGNPGEGPLSGDNSTLLIERTCLRLSLLLDSYALI